MRAACAWGCPESTGSDVRKAAARLAKEFGDDRNLLPFLREQPAPSLPEAQDFLRTLGRESADGEIRALASLCLALAIGYDADTPDSRKEALELARVAAMCDSEVMFGRQAAAVTASNLVDRLTRSSVGCEAPALTGTDREGPELALDDFKGDYVVVAFWSKTGDFFDSTPKTLTHIARDHAGAPLQIVGVGLPGPPYSFREALEKNQPWHFIEDDSDGTLRKRWCVTDIPTVFLLDTNSVIIGRFANKTTRARMSSSGSYRSFFSHSSTDAGAWKDALTNALAQITTLVEPRRKMRRLLTGGPWIARGGWDRSGPGERTVFLRDTGKTSVHWMHLWRLQGPSALHVHVLKTGGHCVDLDLDRETGEARVTSPESLSSLTLVRRDFPPPATDLDLDARRVRDCLLAETWSWFRSGGAGLGPHGFQFRFLTNGTTDVDWLPAWEVLPSARVRLYRDAGTYWTFDLNIGSKIAVADLEDSQITEDRAFAAGKSAHLRVLDLSSRTANCSGQLKSRTGWQEVELAPISGRYVCLKVISAQRGEPVSSVAEIELSGETGAALDRTDWRVAYVSSEEEGRWAAEFAFDGKPATFWHSQWIRKRPPHPHFLVIDLGTSQKLTAIRISSRPRATYGRIKDFELYVSGEMFPLK